MAARLTVIVIQSAQRDSATADQEETLVAELIMLAGLDATLVGPIETMQVDSTDFLCISGFNYNLAVVTSLPVETVAEHWQRLGLQGTVRPIGQGAPAITGQRVIFHVPLKRDSSIEDVTGALNRLLKDRETKTVGIALPQKSDSQAVPRPNTQPAEVSENQKNSAPSAAANDQPRPPRAAPEAANVEEVEWNELEKLVDEFDALDF